MLFRSRFQRDADRTGVMTGLDAFEQQAFNLILGNAPKAFDVSAENAKTREKYGKDLGEQMLVARRLVEAGCGFVTLNYGGWDMHGTIEKSMNQRAPALDRALSALIDDLDERGMLDRTLVVVSGEFGRTPRINKNAGRDHWTNCYGSLLAGAGIRGGTVYGASDAQAAYVADNPVRPADLLATIYRSLGIDPATRVPDHTGRPVEISQGGHEISAVMS